MEATTAKPISAPTKSILKTSKDQYRSNMASPSKEPLLKHPNENNEITFRPGNQINSSSSNFNAKTASNNMTVKAKVTVEKQK